MAFTNRVTNSMLVDSFKTRLSSHMGKLGVLQGQMATGRRFEHISDDPVALIYSQEATNRLRRLEDYTKNLDVAEQWLSQAESSILELNDIFVNAYEACIDGSTDVKNPTDRNNMANYIKQMRDQVLDCLNSATGNKYIFGGYNTTGHTSDKVHPPFELSADGALTLNGTVINPEKDYDNSGIKDTLKLQIGAGVDIDITISGYDVAIFDTTGDPSQASGERYGTLYGILDDLYQALSSGDCTVEEVQKFISPLQKGQDHLLTIAANLGGQSKRIEALKDRYGLDEINYTQMKSEAEDIDQAEAIMNYKMAEATYKAALSTGAYIIQPTLMDFLQ